MPNRLPIERHASSHALAARLAPFGRLVTRPVGMGRPVNQGRAMRHDLGTLAHDPGLVLAMALFEASPVVLPFGIELLERHPGTEQLIVPMHAPEGWIVVVAPDQDGAPAQDRAIAVQLAPTQGVIYGKGVWHLPILVAGRALGSFFVQSIQGRNGRDCIEHRLDHELVLVEAARA